MISLSLSLSLPLAFLPVTLQKVARLSEQALQNTTHRGANLVIAAPTSAVPAPASVTDKDQQSPTITETNSPTLRQQSGSGVKTSYLFTPTHTGVVLADFQRLLSDKPHF